MLRSWWPLLLLLACGGRESDPNCPAPAEAAEAEAPPAPPPDEGAETAGLATTQLHIQGVSFRTKDGGRIEVPELRGEIVSKRAGQPPRLDDAKSYAIRVRAASVRIPDKALGKMLSGKKKGGDNGPKNLDAAIRDNKLVLSGELRKPVPVPFELVGEVGAEDGKLVIRVVSLEAADVEAKGVLDFFDLKLEDIVKSDPEKGLVVEGDRILVDALATMPPPVIEGRLVGARAANGALELELGPADPRSPPPAVEDPLRANSIWFRHGTIISGKMTMRDVDLRLMDQDGRDPFDFALADFRKQVVAGFSKPQPDGGVQVHVPDYEDVGS